MLTGTSNSCIRVTHAESGEVSMSIGSTFREVRLSLQWQQKQIADALGLCQQAISNYENDVNTPNYKILLKFVEFARSKGFPINIEDILKDDHAV